MVNIMKIKVKILYNVLFAISLAEVALEAQAMIVILALIPTYVNKTTVFFKMLVI